MAAVGYRSWLVKYSVGSNEHFIRNLRMPDAQAIAYYLKRSDIPAQAFANYTNKQKASTDLIQGT